MKWDSSGTSVNNNWGTTPTLLSKHLLNFELKDFEKQLPDKAVIYCLNNKGEIKDSTDVIIEKQTNTLKYIIDQNLIKNQTPWFMLDLRYNPNSVSEEQKELRIYPNPATNRLHIENISNIGIREISVVSLLGSIKIIDKELINSKDIILNIESLEPGVYFIEAKYSNSTCSIKPFIKM